MILKLVHLLFSGAGENINRSSGFNLLLKQSRSPEAKTAATINTDAITNFENIGFISKQGCFKNSHKTMPNGYVIIK
jgi:hypothetical protein